jgi:mono/diheme cytochrome c family protein
VQVDDPTRSPAWNRGAYLVEGLGHCAACHAPRNVLGANGPRMTGGVLPDGRWWAPPLPDAHDAADPAAARRHLVDLLRSGRSARGSASGPMAEVVMRSTQHWREPDLQAVADYLLSWPTPSLDEADTPRAAPAALQQGRALYEKHCADCHGLQGEGAPGVYPPLAGNPSVLQPDARNLVRLLDHGSFAPATAANPRPYSMPAQALSDAEAAAVLSYLRQAWGHRAPALSEVNVLTLR